MGELCVLATARGAKESLPCSAAAPEQTAVLGISMGGMGALRLAFKRPNDFRVVAALEPGIEPALEFSEIEPRDRFWRSEELFERIYGAPLERGLLAREQPVFDRRRWCPPRGFETPVYQSTSSVVTRTRNGLHRGTEFLHRVLWDHDVKHEYRSVHGADHVGVSLGGPLPRRPPFRRPSTPPAIRR